MGHFVFESLTPCLLRSPMLQTLIVGKVHEVDGEFILYWGLDIRHSTSGPGICHILGFIQSLWSSTLLRMLVHCRCLLECVSGQVLITLEVAIVRKASKIHQTVCFDLFFECTTGETYQSMTTQQHPFEHIHIKLKFRQNILNCFFQMYNCFGVQLSDKIFLPEADVQTKFTFFWNCFQMYNTNIHTHSAEVHAKFTHIT